MQHFKHDTVVFSGRDIDVILSDEVSQKMNCYRQLGPASKESGGILIGERRGRYWIVTDITTPMKGDIQSRGQFVRQDLRHIKVSKRICKRSKNLRTYMGEWHTHPQVIPQPSGVDLASWKSIKIEKGNSLVFIILGIKGSYGCYYDSNHIHKLIPL
ncbi:MAG: integrative and conjugative element protein (TIGR02256 family) [Nonlabens sp.]